MRLEESWTYFRKAFVPNRPDLAGTKNIPGFFSRTRKSKWGPRSNRSTYNLGKMLLGTCKVKNSQ